jgi:hypothetical protein
MVFCTRTAIAANSVESRNSWLSPERDKRAVDGVGGASSPNLKFGFHGILHTFMELIK